MKWLVFSVLFLACSKDAPSPNLKLAEVETVSAEVTQWGVIVKGKVLSDGGSAISKQGICWTDKLPLPPQITNNLAEMVDTLQIPSGKYYFRAYARNGSGLSYGQMITLVK